MPAHLAALAAGRQGKFWAFHDRCFADKQALTEATFGIWARELGLDVARFDRDRKDPALLAQIAADQAVGEAAGVTGTPAFFVNGRALSGTHPIEKFAELINEELARAGGAAGRNRYTQLIAHGKRKTDRAGLGDTVHDIRLPGVPSVGPANAAVTLTLFTDLQCPFCARLAPPLAEILRKHKDVRLVFAHYPLPFHPRAKPAAVVVQAAFAQGGAALFLAVQDLILGTKDLSDQHLAELAGSVGVDLQRLAAAQKAGSYDAVIAASIAEGERIHVDGTPSLYINGRVLEPSGGLTLATIEKAIAVARKLK